MQSVNSVLARQFASVAPPPPVDAETLAQRRQAAQQCLRLRREAGIPFSPIVIYRLGRELLLAPANRVNVHSLPPHAVLEIVDVEDETPALPSLLAMSGGWMEPLFWTAVCIACGYFLIYLLS